MTITKNAKGRFAGGPSVKLNSIDATIIPLRRKCCKTPVTVGDCHYFAEIYWRAQAFKRALWGPRDE